MLVQSSKEKKNKLDDDKIAKLEMIIYWCWNGNESLVDMLSDSRCDNYNVWINVSICLHNKKKIKSN